MRCANENSVIHPYWSRAALALIVSGFTFLLGSQGLSAVDEVTSSQPALTQQWFPQTAKLVGSPSGSIFLKGTYIELGMHTLGSFGAEDPAYFADGFHPLQYLNGTSYGMLGFIYKPFGWASSSDKPTESGDFFVPGVPEEVWGVSWNYGASNENTVRYMNAGLNQSQSISFAARTVDQPSVFAKANGFPRDLSSGTDRRSQWQGTAIHSALVNQTMVSESLRVTQTVHFDVNDKFFVINVVLMNTGTTTISGLKYLRSVDPDQEAGAPVNGTSGATQNYVAFQPPRGTQSAFPMGNTNKALVVGKGIVRGVTLGLGAIDSRARVAYSTETNKYTVRDPLGVLQLGTNADGVVMADSARAATPLTVDGAISLAFDLGNVSSGQSKEINYVYLVNESDFEVALGSEKNVSIVLPTGTISGSSVLFRAAVNHATTSKEAVTKVDFYVGGKLAGTASTATDPDTYEVTFDSTSFANGSLSLAAVATFADTTESRAMATVTVVNAGSVTPVITEVSTPAIPLSQGGVTTYTAVSPSTTQGISSLLAALGGSNSSVTRAFTWDSTVKSYVELPTEPAGGVVISSGIFVATRVALTYGLSGTASGAPFQLNLRRDGWTFAGVPPVKVATGTFATTFAWPEATVVSPAIGLTISYPNSGTVTLAQAMGNPLGDSTTSRPWFWNGSAYVQVDILESGKGYWFKNNLVNDDIIITVSSAESDTFTRLPVTKEMATKEMVNKEMVNKESGSTVFRNQGTPPPPPSGENQSSSSSSGGCGVGSGVASLVFFLLLFGCRFFVARR